MDNKQEYIERFKTLYKRKHGTDIDDTTALRYFEELVELVRNVYKPIPLSEKQRLERLIEESRRHGV